MTCVCSTSSTQNRKPPSGQIGVPEYREKKWTGVFVFQWSFGTSISYSLNKNMK